MTKIAVIGAGSVYTPELIAGLIRQQTPIHTLTLMDIAPDRLDTIYHLARRMLDHHHLSLVLEKTTSRRAALDGADFVLTQIRVGGMSARLVDEAIPLRYGVIGQETVGPGGIAKTLRTVPVLLDIAGEMCQLCPDAWLINFTNPSGMVTEAILSQTPIKTIGLCNIPTDMQEHIADLLHVQREAVTLDYFGINHLSWVRDVRVNGESCMAAVMQAYIEVASAENDPLFSAELLSTLGMIPSYYLTFYYNHPRMLAEQRHAPQSRAERVMEIEKQLLRLYAHPKQIAVPDLLGERGGCHYSTAALQVISNILMNSGAVQILNIRNQGTFPNLPPEAVIEVPCRVDASGAHPIPTEPLPLHVRGLVEAVKASEQLAVQAAISGDMQTALQALTCHPLVPSFTIARSLLADILTENLDYLPQFESIFA